MSTSFTPAIRPVAESEIKEVYGDGDLHSTHQSRGAQSRVVGAIVDARAVLNSSNDFEIEEDCEKDGTPASPPHIFEKDDIPHSNRDDRSSVQEILDKLAAAFPEYRQDLLSMNEMPKSAFAGVLAQATDKKFTSERPAALRTLCSLLDGVRYFLQRQPSGVQGDDHVASTQFFAKFTHLQLVAASLLHEHLCEKIRSFVGSCFEGDVPAGEFTQVLKRVLNVALRSPEAFAHIQSEQISAELHLEARMLALFESTDRRTLDQFPQPLDQFARYLAETYSGDKGGLHEYLTRGRMDPQFVLMVSEWDTKPPGNNETLHYERLVANQDANRDVVSRKQVSEFWLEKSLQDFGMAKGQAVELFHAIDVDGSGTISHEEFALAPLDLTVQIATEIIHAQSGDQFWSGLLRLKQALISSSSTNTSDVKSVVQKFFERCKSLLVEELTSILLRVSLTDSSHKEEMVVFARDLIELCEYDELEKAMRYPNHIFTLLLDVEDDLSTNLIQFLKETTSRWLIRSFRLDTCQSDVLCDTHSVPGYDLHSKKQNKINKEAITSVLDGLITDEHVRRIVLHPDQAASILIKIAANHSPQLLLEIGQVVFREDLKKWITTVLVQCEGDLATSITTIILRNLDGDFAVIIADMLLFERNDELDFDINTSNDLKFCVRLVPILHQLGANVFETVMIQIAIHILTRLCADSSLCSELARAVPWTQVWSEIQRWICSPCPIIAVVLTGILDILHHLKADTDNVKRVEQSLQRIVKSSVQERFVKMLEKWGFDDEDHKSKEFIGIVVDNCLMNLDTDTSANLLLHPFTLQKFFLEMVKDASEKFPDTRLVAQRFISGMIKTILLENGADVDDVDKLEEVLQTSQLDITLNFHDPIVACRCMFDQLADASYEHRDLLERCGRCILIHHVAQEIEAMGFDGRSAWIARRAIESISINRLKDLLKNPQSLVLILLREVGRGVFTSTQEITQVFEARLQQMSVASLMKFTGMDQQRAAAIIDHSEFILLNSDDAMQRLGEVRELQPHDLVDGLEKSAKTVWETVGNASLVSWLTVLLFFFRERFLPAADLLSDILVALDLCQPEPSTLFSMGSCTYGQDPVQMVFFYLVLAFLFLSYGLLWISVCSHVVDTTRRSVESRKAALTRHGGAYGFWILIWNFAWFMPSSNWFSYVGFDVYETVQLQQEKNASGEFLQSFDPDAFSDFLTEAKSRLMMRLPKWVSKVITEENLSVLKEPETSVLTSIALIADLCMAYTVLMLFCIAIVIFVMIKIFIFAALTVFFLMLEYAVALPAIPLGLLLWVLSSQKRRILRQKHHLTSSTVAGAGLGVKLVCLVYSIGLMPVGVVCLLVIDLYSIFFSPHQQLRGDWSSRYENLKRAIEPVFEALPQGLIQVAFMIYRVFWQKAGSFDTTLLISIVASVLQIYQVYHYVTDLATVYQTNRWTIIKELFELSSPGKIPFKLVLRKWRMVDYSHTRSNLGKGSEMIRQLGAALLDNNVLQTIHFAVRQMSKAKLEVLAEAVGGNQSLKEFVVKEDRSSRLLKMQRRMANAAACHAAADGTENVAIPGEGILKVMLSCSSLCTVCIDGMSPDYHVFCGLSLVLSRMPHLRHLRFRFVAPTDAGPQRDDRSKEEALRETEHDTARALSKARLLSKLTIRGCPAGVLPALMRGGLEKSKSISYLDVSENALDVQILLKLESWIPSLSVFLANDIRVVKEDSSQLVNPMPVLDIIKASRSPDSKLVIFVLNLHHEHGAELNNFEKQRLVRAGRSAALSSTNAKLTVIGLMQKGSTNESIHRPSRGVIHNVRQVSRSMWNTVIPCYPWHDNDPEVVAARHQHEHQDDLNVVVETFMACEYLHHSRPQVLFLQLRRLPRALAIDLQVLLFDVLGENIYANRCMVLDNLGITNGDVKDWLGFMSMCERLVLKDNPFGLEGICALDIHDVSWYTTCVKAIAATVVSLCLLVTCVPFATIVLAGLNLVGYLFFVFCTYFCCCGLCPWLVEFRMAQRRRGMVHTTPDNRQPVRVVRKVREPRPLVREHLRVECDTKDPGDAEYYKGKTAFFGSTLSREPLLVSELAQTPGRVALQRDMEGGANEK